MSYQPPAKRRQPSKATMARVREAFSADALMRICETDDFSAYADRVDLGGDRFYWYRNTGARVLAVGHLDTVQDDRLCQVTHTAAGLLATSGGLDDRLGVYVIAELLPALGVQVDLLLTTDEEIGRSTGRNFAETVGEDHGYNWIIEFDRGGTDVVMYQYETPELEELVIECGARVGQGSYSDIAVMDELGVAAFNWGVGYEDYHSARGHAWLEDTFRMVARFLKFHKANAGTFLPYKPTPFMPLDIDHAWDWDDIDATIEGDCGHMVDLADPRNYIEWVDGAITCLDCKP